jgi:hypothetical protein
MMATTSEVADTTRLAPDDLFERLVHLTNTTDLEIGVTLHVNGLMVTGKLISGTTYWSSSARELRERSVGSRDLVEAMAHSMENLAAEYRETLGNEVQSHPMSGFVHLKDARTVTAKGALPRAGAFWRGRLDCIDGFTLGELGPPASLENM